MRHFWRWFRGCDHQFENTGDFYTDPVHEFTIVLKRCAKCGLVLVVEV